MKYSTIIHLGIRIPLARIFKKRVPFQIFFRLTEKCNLRCSYCKDDYLRPGARRSTTKQVLETIDGLARLGTRRITFFGGEPLLRNDIEKIVTYARSRKIDCSLTTNGILIDKNVNVLKNLDQLSISLDGDKTAHDNYRGEGTWDAAIHAIEVARNHGVPVQLMCTITKLTEIRLRKLFEIAKQYNCTIDLNIVRPLFKSNGSVVLRSEDPGKEKIDELLNYHMNNLSFRLTHSSHVMKYVYNWLPPYTTFNLFCGQIPEGRKYNLCYAGRFFAVIESNGDLLPCCVPRWDYHNAVNVFELGVEDAWKKMPPNNCITCRSLGYNSLNAFFALEPNTLFNFLRRRIVCLV